MFPACHAWGVQIYRREACDEGKVSASHMLVRFVLVLIPVYSSFQLTRTQHSVFVYTLFLLFCLPITRLHICVDTNYSQHTAGRKVGKGYSDQLCKDKHVIQDHRAWMWIFCKDGTCWRVLLWHAWLAVCIAFYWWIDTPTCIFRSVFGWFVSSTVNADDRSLFWEFYLKGRDPIYMFVDASYCTTCLPWYRI